MKQFNSGTIINYKIILTFFLFFIALIETSLIAFPLSVILSLVLYLADSSKKSLTFIFLASLLLDILHGFMIGFTPLFIFITFFVIELYKMIFEVSDYKFLILISLISSLIYAKILDYSFNLIFYLTLLIIFFLIYAKFFNRKKVEVQGTFNKMISKKS